MNGILIINKPPNYTSFDIVAIVRKKINQKKVGHMGTLDPMATGVLPILIGSTSKFQIFTSFNDKEYIFEIKLGLVTDTWDIFGKKIHEVKTNITENEFKAVLDGFKGPLKQIPPMYSAIKKNGIKLCDIARKGQVIERELRDIFINEIKLLNFDKYSQTAKIKVNCSKGTYIRSICFEIGNLLKCGASMGNLCRTLSNSFTIENSISLDKLHLLDIEEINSKYLYSTECLFKNNKTIIIDDFQKHLFKNGINLKLEYLNLTFKISNNEILKVYNNKEFVGIGKIDIESNILKFLKCQN